MNGIRVTRFSGYLRAFKMAGESEYIVVGQNPIQSKQGPGPPVGLTRIWQQRFSTSISISKVIVLVEVQNQCRGAAHHEYHNGLYRISLMVLIVLISPIRNWLTVRLIVEIYLILKNK